MPDTNCISLGDSHLTPVEEMSLQEIQEEAENLIIDIEFSTSSLECQSDEQCRYTPITHKPCGGAESYIAYSILGVDDEQCLIDKTTRYYELDKRRKYLMGGLSTCEVLPPPNLYCDEVCHCKGTCY